MVNEKQKRQKRINSEEARRKGRLTGRRHEVKADDIGHGRN